MKSAHFSTLAMALLVHSAIASAQTPPTNPESVQGTRHAEQHRARWQQADLDKDGQLSKAEAQAAGMKHVAMNFDAIDSNKDGKVSEIELRSWMQSRRAQHQQLHQQHRTTAQGGAVQAKQDPFGKAPSLASGATQQPVHPHQPPSDGGMAFKSPEQRQAAMAERFSKADTNKDGALTKAEAQAAGMHRIVEHFDIIDANKDGKITQDELRAAWARRKP